MLFRSCPCKRYDKLRVAIPTCTRVRGGLGIYLWVKVSTNATSFSFGAERQWSFRLILPRPGPRGALWQVVSRLQCMICPNRRRINIDLRRLSHAGQPHVGQCQSGVGLAECPLISSTETFGVIVRCGMHAHDSSNASRMYETFIKIQKPFL